MPNYRLFLARPEDVSAKERFYLWTGDYFLLYTANKPPKNSREVKDLSLLPALAKQWLNDSIEQIRTEYLKDNEAEILRRGKEFNDRFEAELRAEKEKLEQELTGDA